MRVFGGISIPDERPEREYAFIPHTADSARASDHLASLSYRERRVLMRPSHPRHLYRYLGFDHKADQAIERLRILLVESDLHLRPVSEFNDPFDTSGIVRIGDEQHLLERFTQIHDAGSWQVPVNCPTPQDLMDSYQADPKAMEERLNAACQKAIERSGCCSFTTEPKDILMWSHYGRHHRGLVLRFDIAKDFNLFSQALPMDYEEEYPVLSFSDPTGNWVDRLLRQKYIAWKSEREWRISIPTGSNKFIPLRPEALTGVIFGCKTDQADIDVVLKLLEERDRRWAGRSVRPRIYACKMDLPAYRLRVDRFTV